MALRQLYGDVACDEANALAFLRDRGILEADNVLCRKKKGNVECGASVYQGLHEPSGGVLRPIWRCTNRRCNEKRSVKSANAFFHYLDASRRMPRSILRRSKEGTLGILGCVGNS